MLAEQTDGEPQDAPQFDMWVMRVGAKMVKENLAETGDAENGFDPVLYETRRRRAEFHALRHTFSMLLANVGIPSHTLMKLARHSTIQMTMQYCTHWVLETQSEWWDTSPTLYATLCAIGTHTDATRNNKGIWPCTIKNPREGS
ncbi:MAG: tyrosine-type recombinase/integrase [Planctomycetota bacterium]